MEEDVLERAKKKMVLEYASELAATPLVAWRASLCYPDTHGSIHSVINQMDTSQAHLSSKASASKDTSKTTDLSKDELHAVLKYGAQKM